MAYSQSQQDLHAPQMNMQQQQQYYHQQAVNTPSLQDLMSEHQKQWTEHLVMTGSTQNINNQQKQENNNNNNNNIKYASTTNLNANNNIYPAQHQQYAMWQQQQQQNTSYSSINIINYQQIQQQQMYQQQMVPPMQHQQHSQRSLFQQHIGDNIKNKDFYGSTGQLLMANNNNNNNNNNHNTMYSMDDIQELDEKEEEESINNKHETFVPPPPQSSQEIQKYVDWKAKRNGISEQKRIDLEVSKRQKIVTKYKKKNSLDGNNNNNTNKIDYIHSNSHNISNKSHNIVYESMLSKKGKINKAMQVRYCIAYKNRKLSYFKKPTDKNAAGFIDLSLVYMISIYLPKLIDSKKSDIIDLNKIKRDGMCPINIKSISLKGVNNDFGFELVTNKRVWIFGCNDSNIFKKWIETLKDLCFGKSLHSGYLTKIGQKKKNWKRRFFVCYDLKELRYFENDTMLTQKGKIELNKVRKIVESKPNQYQYPYCIQLYTPQRIWILATESKQDREIWIHGIRNIMK